MEDLVLQLGCALGVLLLGSFHVCFVLSHDADEYDSHVALCDGPYSFVWVRVGDAAVLLAVCDGSARDECVAASLADALSSISGNASGPDDGFDNADREWCETTSRRPSDPSTPDK